jgi:hypothetical protein
MTTYDIYEAAKARGLARSLRQFSRDLLGRCPHYVADRGLERCSAGALLNHLYRRLGELGHADLQALAFERLLEAETRGSGAGAARP